MMFRLPSSSRRGAFAAALLGTSVSVSVFAAEPPMLGVIEELREETASGDKLETNLRLGFIRTADGWMPLCASKPNTLRNEGCTLPEPSRERRWSVIFQGKRVGEVTTAGWADSELYAKIGLLRITSPSIPRIGRRTGSFAAWAGSNTYRPLIGLIGMTPRIGAPWTSTKPTSIELNAVWPAFRQLVKEIPKCAVDQGPVGQTMPIALRHVEVFRVFTTADGEKLVGVRVRSHFAQDCYEASGFASDIWFHLPARAKPRVISGFLPNDWASGLDVVEIGDFDGDGRVEALFWLSGYNENGYVLFFDEFRRKVKFTWLYH